MIIPYRNNQLSRPRYFTHGTTTGFIFVGCFLLGHGYATLKYNEVARRRYFGRYTNLMDLFDYMSPIFERQYKIIRDWALNFDSLYSFWHFRKSLIAEFRMRRNLQEEIIRKQASEGDEVSQILLQLDEVDDIKDLPIPK